MRSVRRGLLRPVPLSASAVVLVLAGCLSTAAPPQTGVGEAIGGEVTSRRARIASFNTAQVIMSTIEVTADSIATLSSDANVRRRALEWKAYAIPTVQRVMFHPDPFVSFLDGWSFLIQMRRYFDDGGGRTFFGAQQQLAIDACGALETGIASSVQRVAGDSAFRRQRDLVTGWADQHPLDNHLYLRRSMSEAAASLLAQSGGGGLAALGSMEDMAQDAQQTAVILASYVPKSVAWQSELLLSQLTDTSRVTPLLHAVDQMEISTAASRFLNETPEMIATERVAVLEAISEERARAIADINRTTMQALEAVFALEREERKVVLAEMARLVAGERAATLAGIDSLTANAFAQARGVVDHVMLRVVELALGMLVVLALLAVPAIRLWKRASS